jgi:hypothetical protein
MFGDAMAIEPIASFSKCSDVRLRNTEQHAGEAIKRPRKDHQGLSGVCDLGIVL